MSEAEEFMKLTNMFFQLVECWKNDGNADRFAIEAYKVGNGEVQGQVKRFASAKSVNDGGELLAAIVTIDIENERKLGFYDPEDEELMPF